MIPFLNPEISLDSIAEVFVRIIYTALLVISLLACGKESGTYEHIPAPAYVTQGLSPMGMEDPSRPAANLKPDEVKSGPKSETLFDEHKRVQTEWLDAARLVVDRTQDSEAAEVLKFLELNLYLLAPLGTDDQTLALEQWGAGFYPVGMYIITDEDQARFPLLKERFTRLRAGTTYDSDSRVLTVPRSVLNPLWRGVIFLHQAAHVKSFADQPRTNKDASVLAREEVKVYEFQSRLMKKLFGEPYRRLLESEIAGIAERSRKLPALKKHLAISVKTKEYNADFEQVFGPGPSTFEQETQEAGLNMDALFTYVDRKFSARKPKKILELKAHLFQQFREALVGDVEQLK